MPLGATAFSLTVSLNSLPRLSVNATVSVSPCLIDVVVTGPSIVNWDERSGPPPGSLFLQAVKAMSVNANDQSIRLFMTSPQIVEWTSFKKGDFPKPDECGCKTAVANSAPR